MKKTLAALIHRVPDWPREAQDEAALVLAAIEERHVGVKDGRRAGSTFANHLLAIPRDDGEFERP
jgi:hypothetical protein